MAAALALTTWMVVEGLQAKVEERGQQREAQGIHLLEFQRLYGEDAVLVVDVRDTGSYEAGHIPGAVNVRLDESEGPAAVRAHVDNIRHQASSRLVVTYCACPSEASSLRAAWVLGNHGVTARALIGGYRGWVDAGGPTYTLPHVPSIAPR
jgi:rhodanese-related sulfurtransferase